MMQIPYPAPPASVDATLVAPGPAFKKEAWKVMAGIIFFAAVYLLLVAATLGLVILTGIAGVTLLIFVGGVFSLLCGVAVMCFGLLTLAFLLKFFFNRQRNGRPGLIEIRRTEDPALFAFIERIARETGSPRPKKIFISANVNAAVFYDSDFWSMFLPVRKNLIIGLGLVNTLNISEFKAVLAHEFGHFSQRSMKLGSYVYNVNRILHDLLYNNDGYSKLLQNTADINSFFRLVAQMTAFVANGMRRILRGVYVVVNRQHMGLSRQMEFHADAISASVSGGNHLVSALRKIELSDTAYGQLLQRYNGWIPKNRKPENIYRQHLILRRDLCRSLGTDPAQGLPPDGDDAGTQGRVTIQDRWASHPSNPERIRHLQRLGWTTPAIEDPAWMLFSDPERRQLQMTFHVYREVVFKETPDTVTDEELSAELREETEKTAHPAMFGKFYQDRDFYMFDITEEITDTGSPAAEKGYFTKEHEQLAGRIRHTQNDIDLLEQIADPKSGVKAFDFEGGRFGRNDIPGLRARLQTELRADETRLSETDRAVIRHVLRTAKDDNQRKAFLQKVADMRLAHTEKQEDADMYGGLIRVLHPIYTVSMSHRDSLNAVMALRQCERGFKERLQVLLEANGRWGIWDEIQAAEVEKYVHGELKYYGIYGFQELELQQLREVMHLLQLFSSGKDLRQKKELLDFQAGVLNGTASF